MKLEETSKIQLDIKSLIGLIFGIVSIAEYGLILQLRYLD